ncbi:MAG TPA: hypothetical protein VKI44_37560 [Acetobacteraceae bacterium]|nr:hypothetical protein [Acetobacteraceae bacterium]
MKIVNISVRVFRHISKQVRDSDGHTHPGDPHETRQALLTISTDDGAEGHCLSPVEVVRRHLINGFVRHVLVGRWYERGLPFLDYDEVPKYLNARADPMDQDGFVHLSQRPGLGDDINFEYIDNNLVRA